MTAPARSSMWIAVALAAGAVVAVGVVILVAWANLSDVEMSAAGWGAMILGIVVTLALGVGLMTLVFISNRRGYDDPGGPRP